MTIDEVVQAVSRETGREARPDSKLGDLVDDSLEFTNLLAKMADEFCEIPDDQVSRLDSVRDLYEAMASSALAQANTGSGNR